tara:strand:+ start:199 stop:387 length:189 start_codon:yes stop_codon:yes gene_type:complete
MKCFEQKKYDKNLVNKLRYKLEDEINRYMDNMAELSDGLMSINEIKRITNRDTKIFINRYDE